MISENEIEEVVKAFKSYITKVIKHSAIDYARKIKSNKYTEIVYSDAIDISVSLSEYDEDTFFEFENKDNIKFHNSKNERAFNTLNKKEREILLLIADGYSDEQIAKKLNISIENVYSSKYIARKKFKRKLEGK